MNQTTRLWGGRFRKQPDPRLMKLSSAAGEHARLVPQDVAGGKAHAAELGRAGLLTAQELQTILTALDSIASDTVAGRIAPGPDDEDVHTFIERILTERIGTTGAKLRAGRSRNDQAANNLKLYLREKSRSLAGMLAELLIAIADQAEEHAASVCPGFTHLQSAQPVTLGHHLMAYFEMFARDRSRLRDARARMNLCPLGSAALAGTGFPLDRDATAAALGFDGPTRNSLDSVSDRDFAIEYLTAAAQCSLHLSRLAEEFVIWASQPFGFVSLSDQWSTGSSIMPQKRNPDAAELVRGHSGRITGALVSLMMTMKGLPLAYSKDMQDDKPPVFEAHDLLGLCIAAMTGMVESATFRTDRMRGLAESGFATATDLADWLVREAGVPFREAHHITGRAVAAAEAQGVRLDQLSIDALKEIDARIDDRVYGILSVDASVNSRTSFGGTAPVRVRAAIAAARKAREEEGR